jgi:hypothetical protein
VASRSMLESLLARVRQRASEPRQSVLSIPPLRVPRLDAEPPAFGGARRAQAVLPDEDIEEYEDELIEIIDEVELPTETPPDVRPRGVPAFGQSAAAVNRGTLDRAASDRPAPVTPHTPARGIGAARPASGSTITASEPLRAEVVSRRPISVAAIAESQGTRRDARTVAFVELLDAALKLGS